MLYIVNMILINIYNNVCSNKFVRSVIKNTLGNVERSRKVCQFRETSRQRGLQCCTLEMPNTCNRAWNRLCVCVRISQHSPLHLMLSIRTNEQANRVETSRIFLRSDIRNRLAHAVFGYSQ